MELLEKLCSAYGPTAHEWDVQRLVAEECCKIRMVCEGDAIGNLYASWNNPGPLKIGIIAHADEIGMQVNCITDDGLLRFRKIGGLRATSLDGHQVKVLTHKGPIDGIVGSDPMNDNGTEKGILMATRDLWIDIGAESRQEAESMVRLGDFVVFNATFTRLGEYRIVSKALDDRLGLYVMLKSLRELKECSLSAEVLAISSVQEEISTRGIKACRKPLDVAIILDVDYATDIPTAHSETGLLKLGGGVGINMNADSNPVLRNMLVEEAAKQGIALQPTVSRNLSGGTDAAQLGTMGDIATLNVNLPLRYMHTHSEMCDIRDIEAAVKVVVALVKRLDKMPEPVFVPWQHLEEKRS